MTLCGRVQRVVMAAMLCLTLSLNGIAQEQPKPQYRIEARRDGKPIGTITIELFPLIAPKAVRYFDSLVAIRFYDTTAFHRVIPGFMIQGGDPNSRSGNRSTWGFGNPNQATVPAEFSPVPYVRGILGAARSDDTNSATSQFFICVANSTFLNGRYTVYGRAIAGMNVADSIVMSPRDAGDNPNVKIEMFVTKIGVNDSVPTTPLLLTPAADTNRITSSQLLTWTPVQGALLYHTEVALDSQFNQIVFRSTSVTPQTTAQNIIAGLTPHYWRTRANNGGFYSPYSAVRSFTSVIAVPIPVYPDTGATRIDTSVHIGWKATNGAIGYRVQVATSGLFTQSSMVYQKLDCTDTSIVISGLQRGKRYYWRVGANASNHTGEYSRTRSFTVQAPTSVQRDEDAAMQLSVYPQPASVQTILQFLLSEESDVQIKVVDMNGRIVATIPQQILPAGEHRIPLSCAGLANGQYTIELHEKMSATIRRVLFSIIR